MVKEIRIYVEGGGDSNKTWIVVRRGFSIFLKDIREIADKKKIDFNIIPCGPRGTAKNDFFTALESNPNAFNVLLVDSESPVNSNPWEHLKNQDNWELVENLDDNCQLMVQAVEAWLIADIESLKKFYGEGFKEEKIPKEENVEIIKKNKLTISLNAASRDSNKGKYHKIYHCSKILGLLDSSIVRSKAPHCERLFKTLTDKMEAQV